MGKRNDDGSPSATPTPPLAETASAISLHTPDSGVANPPMQRYFDDDHADLETDDLPPLYTDHEGDENIDPSNPLIPRGTSPLDIRPFMSSGTETDFYIDKRLEADPDFLKSQLDILSTHPPRPFVHMRGSHIESRRNGDRNEETRIADFDIEVELTHLLYTDISTQSSWRELTAVNQFEKVRRGTVFAKRAPGFGGSGSVAEDGDPGVMEWCHRFCASSAGLKSFTLERRISGWDFDIIRRKLDKLVRNTNYQGDVSIEFPVHNARVEIYNDCRTNRWRMTKWIKAIFVMTLMFLFTWPWLFFRTKRWETVYVSWPLSKNGVYTSLSEEHWYNMWARAIRKAVLGRRQGELDQGDIRRADTEEHPDCDTVAGAVQASVNAMGAVNQSFGWGGHSRGGKSDWTSVKMLGRAIHSRARN